MSDTRATSETPAVPATWGRWPQTKALAGKLKR